MAMKQLGLRMFGAKAARHQPAPVTSLPLWRPLTTKDALYHLAPDRGARVYVRLRLDDAWYAGRQWMHCGPTDGVLLVRWEERYDATATAYWRPLADGRVRLAVDQEAS